MSVVLGVIVGVVGFLPLVAALSAAKHVTSTSDFSNATILILAVLGSSAVLFGAAVACIVSNRDELLFFAGGEVAGIIVAAVAFGVKRILLKK